MNEVPSTEPSSRLSARRLRLGYGGRVVSEELDVDIPDSSFTVIVGPNGSGKSTLLKALARTLPPLRGEVLLDGRPLRRIATRSVAREIALLPQGPVAPDHITVRDLVGRGRFPHQSLLRQWSPEDSAAVRRAMQATELVDLAHRPVATLSGGQRQRVWLAMVLAQATPLLLLDEPTTFLDVAHQLEVLDLCADMHEDGHTLIAVLHDLNLAARYATHLIVMRAGAVVASGPPTRVVTPAMVEEVFGIQSKVLLDPTTGTSLVVPLDRASRRQARMQAAGSLPTDA